MDFIRLLVFIWLASVFLAGTKMLFDQNKLLKLYRKQVNPPYPIVPGENPNTFKTAKADPLGITVTMRWLKVTFSKHPNYPELAKLARRVRLDFLAAMAIGFGGFALLGVIILTSSGK